MDAIRRNSFNWDGTDGVAVTIDRSALHGDALDNVDTSGVSYDQANTYTGAACLRLDDPDASNGIAWTGLSLSDCALRVYVKRTSAAESGNLWWNNSVGSASIGVGGDVGTSGLLLEEALPADTWCRVEFTRDGTSATLSAWSADPQSTGAPDATDTGTVDGSEITQWWLEHQGDAVFLDEWALGDTADELGPVLIDLLRSNTGDGPAGAQVTTTNSGGSLGDAWSGTDDGIVYDADSYIGSGSLLFPSGFDSGTGVVWSSLSLIDFAVRGYLKRAAAAEEGHVWWASGTGGCALDPDGGLDWYGVGLVLPAGTIPADTWVRVEARREGDTGHLAVWSSDPQGSVPDAATSGTITTDTVTQWWWERFGTGEVRWDEPAVTDAAKPIGPADIRVGDTQSTVTGEHAGWGLPVFLLSPSS